MTVINKVKFSPIANNEGFKTLECIGKPGEIMAPHLASEEALLIVGEGSISFELAGEKMTLSQGGHVKIPAEAVHGFTVESPARLWLTVPATAKIQFVH